MKHSEGAYHFDVLQSKHADQAEKLITKAFCQHEPMTGYLKINADEFMPLAKMIIEKAIVDKLSVVAIKDNTVIACSIVEDITDPLNITTHLDSRFKYIFSLLDQLGTSFYEEREFGQNHIAHLFVTAVHEDFMGKHLSTQVNLESMRIAEKNNFSFMYSEFSNLYNEQGIIKHLETSSLLVSNCSYHDFVFNGEKPFANLSGSASAYIWELKPGAKLEFRQDGKNYFCTLEELDREAATA